MVVCSHAATLALPNVEEAKAQAAQNGKPAIIIWYGSDWQYNVDDFVADWQSAANTHKGTYVFGQFDDKTGLDGEIRKKALPIEHFNLPAVVMLAPNGSFMAEVSGTSLKNTAQHTLNMLEPLAARSTEFASLVAKAKAESGPKAAQTAAQALALLPIEAAMRHKELTQIINKQDPQDSTGFRAQYCLDHLGMYDEINGILQGGKEGKLRDKNRKFDEAEAYVRKVLCSKSLQGTERRQQWLAGLAYIQRERILSTTKPEKRDVSSLLNTLSDIIKLDPNSQYGIGATKFHHYWNPRTHNTITTNYYTRGDQTLGFEKDWHIDVTSSIDGPGTYIFSLEPVEHGNMISRNFRLVADGKIISTPHIPATQNIKTVEFHVPALPANSKIEVWLTAQCNDGWMEASGFIKMKKKN